MVDDHLFSPANAEHYATTMRAGLDVLTEHLGSVRTPFSGRSVTDVHAPSTPSTWIGRSTSTPRSPSSATCTSTMPCGSTTPATPLT